MELYINDKKYQSEECCKSVMKYLNNRDNSSFQLIVSDDNDEEYIPNLDFPYEEIDCSIVCLNTMDSWDKIVDSGKTYIFKNTSALFDQFRNLENIDDENDNSGIINFCKHFCLMHRHKFINGSKSKLFFLISEDSAKNMINNSYDELLSIMISPLYLAKDKNKKNGNFVKIKK